LSRANFWVSDRYGGQPGWATKDSQVCLAHPIRDARYAIDAGDAELSARSTPSASPSPESRCKRRCDGEDVRNYDEARVAL
jgi:hypothetical protein